MLTNLATMTNLELLAVVKTGHAVGASIEARQAGVAAADELYERQCGRGRGK